jgi:hypothetical protein
VRRCVTFCLTSRRDDFGWEALESSKAICAEVRSRAAS